MTRSQLSAAIVCVMIILAASSAFCSVRIDKSEAVLTLPDYEQVILIGMFVHAVIDRYAFVSDFNAHSPHIPIYTPSATAKPSWSVQIAGRTATVGGKRIVIADEIRLYTTDSAGLQPAPPMFAWLESDNWPYLSLLPNLTTAPSDIPAVPDLSNQIVESTPISAPAGSVASAKVEIAAPETSTPQAASVQSFAVRRTLSSSPPQLSSGPVEITGAVVTAIFYEQTPKVFYIQSTDCPSGIKVIPSIAVPVEVGNLVDIKGMSTCASSDAEARVIADSVACTGSHILPNPIGMSQRLTVGSAFGIQPELYKKTSSPTETVGGLNAVGVRVRVWGNIVSGSGTTYWLDDGSSLKSTVGSEEKTGIRLIFATAPSPAYTQGQNIAVTGVLGAEMSDDVTPCPVPVVRIPADTTRPVKYVKMGGTGDGSSWTNAYGSMQSAIDSAYAANPKCEVWVAAGTYSGTNGRITLKDGVAVYGGFAGLDTETMREQRNWTTNVTILNGQQNGTVVTTSSGVTGSARIDGFTIRNGLGYGGGVFVGNYCSPVIANNIIRDNNSNGNGGGICLGNALNSYSGSWIWGNQITSNSGSYEGGGLYAEASHAVIVGNEISNNFVHDGWSNADGGGMYFAGGNPVVRNNSITGNWCDRWGGGINYSGSGGTNGWILDLEDNVISGNSTGQHGGGLYVIGLAYYTNNVIKRNRFEGNTAAWDGAALALYNSSVDIVDNLFLANTVTTANGYGGGAIYCDGNEYGPWTYAIINNTFAKNRTYPIGQTAAGRGGAILIYRDSGSSSASILNNIFFDNIALNGQSVYADKGTHTVAFCDAWNPGANNDAALHYRGTQGNELVVDVASCIYGDPLFVDTVDYRLQLNIPTVISPCIDRGHNPGTTPYDTVPNIDFDGLPRPIDIDDLYAPNYGTSAYCDMGAYEARP